MKPNQVIKICDACGKIFSVKASKAPTRIWCSKRCWSIGMRKRRQLEIETEFNEPLRDLLQRLYHKDQKGIKEIAKLIGVSDRNLWSWFEELHIDRRNKSDAVKLQWKNNEERHKTTSERMRKKYHIQVPTLDDRLAFSIKGNIACSRASPTKLERRLMDGMDEIGLQYIFQFNVGNKFLCDFAFPESMLIVECDGEYWHNTQIQRKRDASKDKYLQACGYTVLRLSEKHINENLQGCLHAIQSLL